MRPARRGPLGPRWPGRSFVLAARWWEGVPRPGEGLGARGRQLPRPPPARAAPRDPLRGPAPSSRRCARGGAACRGRSKGCSSTPGPDLGSQRSALRPRAGSGLCPGGVGVPPPRRRAALRGCALRSFCLPEELRARFCPGTRAEGRESSCRQLQDQCVLQIGLRLLFFFLIYIFRRTLESVVLIRLLQLKASLGTPLQAKVHLSEGGLWGFESHAQVPMSR